MVASPPPESESSVLPDGAVDPGAGLPVQPWVKIAVLALLGSMAIAAVPGYGRLAWRWQQDQAPAQLKTLRQLPQRGLALPGWQSGPASRRSLGGETWLWQPIERPRPDRPDQRDRVVVLVMPMKQGRDRPQVEWSALDSGNWLGNGLQTDSERTITVTPPMGQPFRMRLLRLWTQDSKTYFLASWYAWPNGGDPEPSQWFWRDRLAQWQQQHLPWVATSLLLPADKPLDELDATYESRLSQLAATVQATLLTGPLATPSPAPRR
ncbi:MAG: cyanoexosortase B system-associated protein [Oscillatoriales cyanobacterium]|nr:MAG: cyanoexosortase B system-associated protein [Oscillatoriales cyanobacterium]